MRKEGYKHQLNKCNLMTGMNSYWAFYIAGNFFKEASNIISDFFLKPFCLSKKEIAFKFSVRITVTSVDGIFSN